LIALTQFLAKSRYDFFRIHDTLTVYFTSFGARCFSCVGYDFFDGGILR
jgi:hypothetical protein